MISVVLPKLTDRQQAIEDALRRIRRMLEAMPLAKSYKVEVSEHKPVRTSQQNKYLWGVIYPAIIEQGKLEGWTNEEVHDYCLGECFGWETVSGLGRTRIRPVKRSSKLTNPEFSDYINFIQHRMAEHGIYVPDADEEFA